MTLSAAGLGRLRERLPDTLLVTDDLQMQGLQKALGTRRQPAIAESRMDMLCIGKQPVRSGAGNGRHRRIRRTEPAREDLVRPGNREIDRAGG